MKLALFISAFFFIFNVFVSGTVAENEKEEILLDVPLTPGYLIYLAKGELDVWRMLTKYRKSTKEDKKITVLLDR